MRVSPKLLLFTALLATSVFAAGRLEARETLNGSRGNATYAAGDDEELDDGSQATAENPLCLVMGGRTYISQYRTRIPTMKQTHNAVCDARKTASRRNLCSIWDQADNSFTAAARVFGVPAPALVCLMEIESNMTAGRTSSARARGLTQFTDRTARGYERNFRRSSEYKQAWSRYEQLGGTSKPSSAFTQSHIQGRALSDYDVQVFATAMYFHVTFEGLGSLFRTKLGPGPEPDKNGLKMLLHYFLISYNSTAAHARKYMIRGGGEAGARTLKSETRQYLKNFDACIDKASKL